MTTFQRARSDEQRAVRRRAILDAASAMLAEMSVADVSLNELARRVGLAKSNVLRYFDSREAVLLELLDAHWAVWLDDLATELPAAVTADTVDGRCDQLAAALAGSLAGRPVFCDLIANQAAVLERNISPGVAAAFKRGVLAATMRLAHQAHMIVPELTLGAAGHFAGAASMSIGAIWTHTHPSPAMVQAYLDDPQLASMRLDFARTLQGLLVILLAGLLARPDAGAQLLPNIQPRTADNARP